MTTPYTIPLPALIRAITALRAAKDTPVGAPLKHADWITIMKSYNELDLHLERLTKGQTVEVAHG